VRLGTKIVVERRKRLETEQVAPRRLAFPRTATLLINESNMLTGMYRTYLHPRISAELSPLQDKESRSLIGDYAVQTSFK
jgi:hypothetical protein